MPAAVGVVLDAGNDAGLDGVLMDVTEEGGEVVHVVDGLAAETLLEEVAAALVLAVVRGDKKEDAMVLCPINRKTRQFRESAGIRKLGYVQVMQRLDQALRRQKYNFFLI